MLIVAVSSRALFNLEDGNDIFNKEGVEAFDDYMRANEHKPLRPGAAFLAVKKLLALNAPGERDKVSVMLLSSNTLEAGARVMNSVRHFGLAINRACFTSGGDRCEVAKAENVTMFLTTNPAEARKALDAGISAAVVMPSSFVDEDSDDEPLVVALDGDGLVLSDEAEQVNQREGLDAFNASEKRQANVPMGAGPFTPVLMALHEVQKKLAAEKRSHLLKVALVTARSVSVYERVLCTFRHWGVRLDQAYFRDGSPKGPLLKAIKASIFFDDGMHNIESASPFVAACHVPHGVLGTKVAAAEATA